MNCARVNDLLEFYLEDLLDFADRPAVERHLAECQDCRVQRDRAQEIEEILEEAAEPVRPEAVAAGLRRLRARLAPPLRFKDRFPMAAAAILILGLLGTFLTLGRSQSLIRSARSGNWSEGATWEG